MIWLYVLISLAVWVAIVLLIARFCGFNRIDNNE